MGGEFLGARRSVAGRDGATFVGHRRVARPVRFRTELGPNLSESPENACVHAMWAEEWPKLELHGPEKWMARPFLLFFFFGKEKRCSLKPKA